MDETGLFYKLGPNRALAQRAVAKEKRSNECITIALTANMDENIKLKPLVINKSLKLRVFSHRHVANPNNLGIEWYANPKAWVNGVVCEKFLQTLDVDMIHRGRKQIIFLVDNASSHIHEHL
ncbi:hypothetical protein R1flu_022847 [Riccia fluitans]|uniref:DDE-1 domain-containing protein n=1 Tax=Riccia fluitans TaxID=41844 RepID=A0ABD1XQV9_9MARC